MQGRTSDPAGLPAGEGHLLAIDLGATNTVALIRRPDGQTRPLLFDGEPVLPSGVLIEPDGTVRVGRDAGQRAPLDPAGFEPAPRQRIAEPAIQLGDRKTTPAELLASLLTEVAAAAIDALGFLPPAVLTHPADWGVAEQATLQWAAERAGFPPVALMPEPIAAASGRPVPVGARLAIVDVGARGFDVAVVQRVGDDFVLLATGGDRTVGGRRVDAAIAVHLAGTTGRHQREIWQPIDRPRDAEQRRLQRAFWDEVRCAKEMLSRAATAPVLVPGLVDPVTLRRDDLDRLARPLVERVARVTKRVLRDAHVKPSELDTVLLIGGSARLAVLGSTLRRAFAIEPTPIEQPELAVAAGALDRVAGRPAARGGPEEARTALALPAPPRRPALLPPVRAGLPALRRAADVAVPAVTTGSGERPRDWRRYWWAVAAVVLMLIGVALVVGRF